MDLDEDRRVSRSLGVVENLSLGGMCVHLSRHGLRPHTTVPLQILFERASVRVAGKFCWIDRDHAGIAFGFVPESSLAAVRRWIDDHNTVTTEIVGHAPIQESVVVSTMAAPVSHPPVAPPAGDQPEDPELTQLAKTACRLVGLSGIAVAVRHEDTFECRASVGCAPSIGARTNAEAGLSGLCIRSREIVTCEDVRHDSRIPVASETLGFASACVVPVAEDENVIALITAFRDHPSVFDHHDVDVLRMVACAASILGRRSHEPSGNCWELGVIKKR